MTTHRVLKLLLVLPAISIAAGCASITRGPTDSLQVNSTPSDANIEIYRTDRKFTKGELRRNTLKENQQNSTNTPLVAETPASFKLARKGKYKVVITKPGYQTKEVTIDNHIGAAGRSKLAGNLLFGGIIGAGIDAKTGSLRDLTPNPVEVTLDKDGLTTGQTIESTDQALEGPAGNQQSANTN